MFDVSKSYIVVDYLNFKSSCVLIQIIILLFFLLFLLLGYSLCSIALFFGLSSSILVIEELNTQDKGSEVLPNI